MLHKIRLVNTILRNFLTGGRYGLFDVNNVVFTFAQIQLSALDKYP